MITENLVDIFNLLISFIFSTLLCRHMLLPTRLSCYYASRDTLFKCTDCFEICLIQNFFVTPGGNLHTSTRDADQIQRRAKMHIQSNRTHTFIFIHYQYMPYGFKYNFLLCIISYSY